LSDTSVDTPKPLPFLLQMSRSSHIFLLIWARSPPPLDGSSPQFHLGFLSTSFFAIFFFSFLDPSISPPPFFLNLFFLLTMSLPSWVHFSVVFPSFEKTFSRFLRGVMASPSPGLLLNSYPNGKSFPLKEFPFFIRRFFPSSSRPLCPLGVGSVSKFPVHSSRTKKKCGQRSRLWLLPHVHKFFTLEALLLFSAEKPHGRCLSLIKLRSGVASLLEVTSPLSHIPEQVPSKYLSQLFPFLYWLFALTLGSVSFLGTKRYLIQITLAPPF